MIDCTKITEIANAKLVGTDLFVVDCTCSPANEVELLIDSDTSVLEVGSRAGFATPTSFTRQFKKTFGMTPGKWRARMMGAESDSSTSANTAN